MAYLIGQIFYIFYLILIARVIISWLPQFRKNAIADIIYKITDPVLAPIQKVLPPLGGLDWSVFALILLMQMIQKILF